MKVVALVSLKGGTGRTTLTALLATRLARRGQPVWAVDVDPQGALGLHFGMPPGTPLGLAHPETGAAEVEAWLKQSAAPVPYVPFGACGPDALARLEADVARDPAWLSRRLAALAPDARGFVLLDVAAGPTPWLRQALAIADAALVVLLPDAASYATLPATEALFAGARPPFYLVNQMDGRRPLCGDVWLAMGRVLRERLLPWPIHADERVREALAKGTTLLDEPDGSQVVADLAPVADWLLALSVAETKAPARVHEHAN
jgi:chromosome partitioning protein